MSGWSERRAGLMLWFMLERPRSILTGLRHRITRRDSYTANQGGTRKSTVRLEAAVGDADQRGNTVARADLRLASAAARAVDLTKTYGTGSSTTAHDGAHYLAVLRTAAA